MFGGDQKVRGDAGYVGQDGVPRLNILEVQRQIRTLPKPVIAMVAGYAVGGGHVLHMMCDLTIAADNANLAKQVQLLVHLMEDGERHIWLELLAKNVLEKCGIYVSFMMLIQLLIGDW